jgi:citrate synthase
MADSTDLSSPITQVGSTELVIRGVPVEEIVRGHSYEELICLLLRLDLTPGERDVLRACLVVNSDHGRASNATTAARAAAATNRAGVSSAVAAGLLAVGAVTISPRSAMQFLRGRVVAWREAGTDLDDLAAAWLTELKRDGRLVPGYGSPFHPHGDPRVAPLREVAEAAGTWGDHGEVFVALGSALRGSGRDIPANEVGMVAACLADIGLTPDQGEAVSILATVPSLVANVLLERDERPRFLLAEPFSGYGGSTTQRDEGGDRG